MFGNVSQEPGEGQRGRCVSVEPTCSLMVGQGQARVGFMKVPWECFGPSTFPRVSFLCVLGHAASWPHPTLSRGPPVNPRQIPLPLASTRWRTLPLCFSRLGFGCAGRGGGGGVEFWPRFPLIWGRGGKGGYAQGWRIRGGEWKAGIRCSSHVKITEG